MNGSYLGPSYCIRYSIIFRVLRRVEKLLRLCFTYVHQTVCMQYECCISAAWLSSYTSRVSVRLFSASQHMQTIVNWINKSKTLKRSTLILCRFFIERKHSWLRFLNIFIKHLLTGFVCKLKKKINAFAFAIDKHLFEICGMRPARFCPLTLKTIPVTSLYFYTVVVWVCHAIRQICFWRKKICIIITYIYIYIYIYIQLSDIFIPYD